jgi:hypothetical protein
MNTAEMPSSHDARIEEAFGQPLAVLYGRAEVGAAAPEVHRALELRSFLAAVERAAIVARDRLHETTRPQSSLHGLSREDLRLNADLLEEAIDIAAKYGRELSGLLPASTQPSSSHSAEPGITPLSASRSALTTSSGPVPEPTVEAGTGRHRR